LEDKWQKLLKVIQVYITCEGRYGRVMLYHFRIINHFTGKNPLNLPHYLHRSLTKMAQKVQAKPEKINSRLFHHGLIKLIVMGELQRRERTWDYLLFWGEFEQEIQPKGKNTPTKKSSTPKSSKRKRRALSPVQTEQPTPSPRSKKEKKKLDFDQGIEVQGSIFEKNILNFPYSDSESETPMKEKEETAVEAPALELPETSTKKKISKASKIQKLKEEVTELRLLDRVIKSQNQAMKRTSDEVRDSFKRLALMHVALKRKNKRLSKKNQKFYQMIKLLRFKLAHRRPKPRAHLSLETLAEVAMDLNKES
jgi:hypothetical protein